MILARSSNWRPKRTPCRGGD